MIIGHDAVVLSLESSLPPVSLFRGPKSVGKRTTALHLRKYYGVGSSDFLYVDKLSAPAVQELLRVSRYFPAGNFRLIVLRLDGASTSVQDALLLTLEEASDSVRFILLSSDTLTATLVSRAQVFNFSLLSDSDMEKVLKSVLSESANVERLAKASGGQVSRAFRASRLSEQRSQVIQVLQSFKARDATFIEKNANSWSEEHTSLLETWCQELVTGRWRLFEPGEVGLDDRKLAIRLLMAVRGGVRPRLVVRSRLMDIWRDYTA